MDPLDRNAAMLLAGDLESLEQRAHRLGMTLTAQAINRAKNVAGWQAADNDEAAAQAMSGEHPTRK